MRTRAGWVVAVLTAVCLKAAGGPDPASRFRYATPLWLPVSAQEELAEVVLTPDVYRETRDDLADIRILRWDVREAVPCLVECVTEEREDRVRQSVGLRLVRAEELEGQRFQVTLEREGSGREKAEPLSGVVIHTPLRDFERRVTVETSSDGNAWQPEVRDARILDLSSHADFSVREIRLPAVAQRYVRLTVDRMDDRREGRGATVTTSSDAAGAVRNIVRQIREEQRPFRIDRVDGWTEQVRWVRDARPLTNRAVRVTSEDPAELKARFPEARRICFEAGRVPLARLLTRSAKSILSLSYLLFERVDQTSAEAPEWRQVASGEVARIVFQDFAQERMEIAFAESRAAAYCLVLTDGAGAAELEVVGGKGPSHRVVFPYGAGQSFALLAGDPDAVGAAGYQPEQLRLLLRKGFKPVSARLEGWCENPGWLRAGGRFFSSEASWLLPAAVAFAVVVLGFAVVLALRRMPGPPK